jgi:1-acyl-sn-glycerol-3-phosphate acyltransferase
MKKLWEEEIMSDELEAQLNDFFDAAGTYLFTPLTLLKFTKVLLNLNDPDDEAGYRPEKRDPAFTWFAAKLLKKFTDIYFRPELRGITKLPEKGAGLIVGNHNGGLIPADTFIAGGAIVRHFGGQRPLYALAHDFLFREPTLSNILERMGTLKASYKSAQLAFDQGGLVLVYPGGDYETFRPFKSRHKIEFGNRKGFVKLAIKNGVPVYPLVSIGCHEMFYVLTRGEKIAKFFNLKKKLRTSVFPIVFSFPWGLTSGFLPYIPLPSKIVIEFLDPIKWDFKPEDAENPEIVDRCYNQVKDAMQNAMDRLSKERELPVIG